MSDPDLEAIRAMLRECVGSQGLRRVAGQVGMSPSGLRQFMGGTNAALPTRDKVRAWCRRQVQGDRRTRREVLVDELLADSPAPLRAALRRTILALLADGEAGASRPAGLSGDAAPLQPIVYLDFRTCPLPPGTSRE